jgi:hypothetical protein
MDKDGQKNYRQMFAQLGLMVTNHEAYALHDKVEKTVRTSDHEPTFEDVKAWLDEMRGRVKQKHIEQHVKKYGHPPPQIEWKGKKPNGRTNKKLRDRMSAALEPVPYEGKGQPPRRPYIPQPVLIGHGLKDDSARELCDAIYDDPCNSTGVR